MSVANPLDRPVRVMEAGEENYPVPRHAWVVPSRFLAALDDDAREQMVEQIRDVLLGLDTTTPTRLRERDARAVVDAICGGRDA